VAHEQHVLTDVPARRRVDPTLLAAFALTGVTMRTAVTSVGAALDDLQAGLHTSSGVAGVITTLPVISFAVVGAATPRLAHRIGPHRLLVLSLLTATAGTVARATSGSVWLFVVLSVFALSGGAVSNVLLPSLVKLHAPDQIGRMTAVYSTSLAVGIAAASGLTVPIGDLGDGWRLGIGSWAVLSAVAVLPWLPTLRNETHDPTAERPLAMAALRRSPTAWLMTTFFAFQSMQAYIQFGWFAKFEHRHGVATSTAGWMLALLSALSIPVSMVAPRIPPRHQRAALTALSACSLTCYVGLAVAPVGGAWVWMGMAGLGGGTFPLALALIGMRARTADTTAALSAFAQTIGYVVAGTGPLLFGVLYGATSSWAPSLSLLFASLGISFVCGWLVCRPAYVDDELAPSAP
jgi:CP family cyanate transporter-like MFS transporter